LPAIFVPNFPWPAVIGRALFADHPEGWWRQYHSTAEISHGRDLFLNAQLLFNLKRLQLGAFFFQICIDKGTNADAQNIRELGGEICLDFHPLRNGTQGSEFVRDTVDRCIDVGLSRRRTGGGVQNGGMDRQSYGVEFLG